MPRSGKRSQCCALLPIKRAPELSGICESSQLEFTRIPDGVLITRSLQSAEARPGAWTRCSCRVLSRWGTMGLPNLLGTSGKKGT